MRIAQVSPLAESVPPKLYGGTERIVSYLTEELVRQGHDVTLFASGDSRTSAELLQSSTRHCGSIARIKDPLIYSLLQFDEVRARSDEFDVIHFHTDYLHFPLLRELALGNALTTLHGRLDLPGYPAVFARHSQRCAGLHLERSAAAAARGELGRHRAARVTRQPSAASSRRRAATTSRSSAASRREKRVDRAIEIARRAGMKLRIAAKVDAADREYFETHIESLLSQPHVEYVGEIGERDKREFLGQARALLFPIDWPEPFGLVMIEAMSCGTPCVAWRAGSVPEIISEGSNGFIVDSIEERRCGGASRGRARSGARARLVRATILGGAHDARLPSLYRRLTAQEECKAIVKLAYAG